MSQPNSPPLSTSHGSEAEQRSTVSSRPPTYISRATLPPTYNPRVPDTVTHQDPQDRVRVWNNTVQDQSTASPAQETISDTSTEISVATIGTAPTLPYIYYQVFSQGEAIPTRQRAYVDDQFIGRVVAIRVPPPHTAASIKRYLSRQEYLTQYADLFIDFTSPSPVADDECIDIAAGGPWSTPERPMALVLSDASVTPTASVSVAPAAASSDIPLALSFSLEDFGMRLKTTCDSKAVSHGGYYLGYPVKFPFTKGEIMYTNGRILPREGTGEAYYRALRLEPTPAFVGSIRVVDAILLPD